MKLRMTAMASFALVAGCELTPEAQPANSAELRVVNGASSAGSVRVYLDGQAQSTTVPVGQASAAIDVLTGSHTVELRPTAGGTGFVRTFDFEPSKPVFVVGLDSAGKVTPALVADSNATVPAGATKLRVVHMAQAVAPISVWRTQPDFGTPIRIVFPFTYRFVSAYVQSTPGDWRVMISTEVTAFGSPSMPDTLANTGLIAIGSGESRTVIAVDKVGGGVALVVLDP